MSGSNATASPDGLTQSGLSAPASAEISPPSASPSEARSTGGVDPGLLPEYFSRTLPAGFTPPPAASAPAQELGGAPVAATDQPVAQDPQEALRAELEQSFEERRRGLQSTYDKKLEASSRQLVGAMDQVVSLRAQNSAMRQFFEKFATDNRLDSGVVAQFKLASMEGMQQGQAYARQIHQSVSDWEQHNRAGHERALAQLSEGGQLFDPSDPELATLFETFLEDGRRAGRSGSRDPGVTGAAERSFAILQERMRQMREAGLARQPALSNGVGQAPPVQPAPVAGTPAANRLRADERGEQLLSTGSQSGTMTLEDIMVEAKQLIPGETAKAKEARYLHFMKRQRELGLR